jgi:uncharacterized protein YxjI
VDWTWETLTVVAAEAFSSDRYAVEQLIRPIANLYRVSADGSPVAFVRQKRLALKEDLRFFADEDETEELFRIKARSLVDVTATSDVTAADGTRIGALAKVFGVSLLRSTWRLLDADGTEIARAQEQNMIVALVRRFTDFPLPYHFEIRSADGRELGTVRRAWSVRDRYELDLSNDVGRTVDRRLGVALTVALDALQSR